LPSQNVIGEIKMARASETMPLYCQPDARPLGCPVKV
jgi:hypothetical protein